MEGRHPSIGARGVWGVSQDHHLPFFGRLKATRWLRPPLSCPYWSILASCTDGKRVEVAELMSAVTAANNNVSVDLEEAQRLADIADKVKTWLEAAEFACGSRKHSRNKKALTIDKLREIIEESATLPVDTDEYQRQLSDQLLAVQEWQHRATSDLEHIRNAYETLRGSMREAYGPPTEFSLNYGKSGSSASVEADHLSETEKGTDEVTASSASSEAETIARLNSDESGVLSLVSSFLKDSQSMAIRTPEGDCAVELDAVCRWIAKSAKYLESHRDVFDKRFFGAFDRFMAEGRELGAIDSTQRPSRGASPLLSRLKEAWMSVVTDQMERLGAILKERERYTLWCEAATSAIEERRLSLEKLRDLSRQSRSFPVACDTVRKVQCLEERTHTWTKLAGEQLSSGSKLTQHDARSLMDEGEKLGVVTAELRALRAALKAANGWANRVKRCKPESSRADSKSIQDLLDEHETLLIEMPDEAKRLKKAIKAYCICRRPYDGFMVGCDACDDWFHGPCIGVSESKAGRVDKFVCVRCQLTKLYESSAAMVAAVIKKWTSAAECRKARQFDVQKFQRKLRKESKEIEKLRDRRDRIRKDIENAQTRLLAASPLIETGVPTAQAVANAEPSYEVSSGATTSDDLEAATSSSEPRETVVDPPISVEELESTLVAVEKSLAQCQSRRDGINETLALRRNEEEIEDANSDLLRQFAVVVRSTVLVPESKELAEAGRPLSDGSLSHPMQAIAEESQAAGMLRFQDVQEVLNAFECMSWCLRAKSVMSRHPHFEDVQSLVRHAGSSKMRLPHETALRVLRGLTQRATAWQIRVMKAIAPSPGEVRPFDIDHLRDLSKAGDDIPLVMTFQARLAATIDDQGIRHCICGGPSDGRLMLSCDACDRWFHSQCVGLSKDASAELGEWKCPECSGIAVDVSQNRFQEFHSQYDCPDESSDSDDESLSLASGTEQLWPPYGLLGSEKALEAIGKEASEMPPLLHIQVPAGEGSTGVPQISPSGPHCSPKASDSQQASSSSPAYHLLSQGYPPNPAYYAGALAAAGPYGTMSHGMSPPHYTPSHSSSGTPPRATAGSAAAAANPPVMFGSPGLTVLSPAGMYAATDPSPATRPPPASLLAAGVMQHPSYSHSHHPLLHHHHQHHHHHPFAVAAVASLPPHPHQLLPPLGYPSASVAMPPLAPAATTCTSAAPPPAPTRPPQAAPLAVAAVGSAETTDTRNESPAETGEVAAVSAAAMAPPPLSSGAGAAAVSASPPSPLAPAGTMDAGDAASVP